MASNQELVSLYLAVTFFAVGRPALEAGARCCSVE